MAAGALPAAEAADAEAHLAGCQACQDYFRQIQAVSRGVQELSQSQAVPSPRFDIRWRAAVAAAAAPPAPPRPLWWLVSWARLAWADNRPALAGLGAVWLAIVFLRLTAPQIADTRPLRPPLPPPRAILSVLKQQERLFSPPRQPGPIAAPQPAHPLQLQPRSELPTWPPICNLQFTIDNLQFPCHNSNTPLEAA
jgi:anti-sigma factor RsiW